VADQHRAARTPALWLDRYDRILETKFQTAAAVTDESRCVLELLELLAPERRRRFLRAPAIASQLFGRERSGHCNLGVIGKALLAELAIVGVVSELDEELWTAYGDRCLAPDAPTKWLSPPSEIGGTQIVLDTGSPLSFRPTVAHDLIHLNEDETRAVEHKICAAIETVRASSNIILDFLSDFIDVIVV
jgi:hypothetical protein